MKDTDSEGDEEKPQYGPQMPDPRKEEEGQRKIQSGVGVATVTVTAIGDDSDDSEQESSRDDGDGSDDELDEMGKRQALRRKLEKANGGELSKARAPVAPSPNLRHPTPPHATTPSPIPLPLS